jgi:spore maturation protein CgeB
MTKGYSNAFRELSYFVIEKKFYDINVQEVNQILPDIIFIFWTGLTEKDRIKNLQEQYNCEKTTYIHCAEYLSEIPKEYKKKKNNHLFTLDSKTKKRKLYPAISHQDYKTKFNGYKYNITFAGNPAYRNREEILAKIIYNFGPINIFCRSFDFYKSADEMYENKLLDEYFMELYKQSYKGYVNTQKELSSIYSATKINIDINNGNPKNINYRCLEILSSGGFLISQFNEEIIKYFEDGKELETYTNANDLTDKIRFYQNNLNIAQMIAIKGKRNAASNFSYYDRLKGMLKVIYGKNIGNR